MNDFGINISGAFGVVKPRSFSLPKNSSVKDRTFLIESGSGCSPEIGTGRKIKGRWLADNMPDTISSYDFEHVLLDGKKVNRLPEEVIDVQPVMLTSEVKETKTKPRGRSAWKSSND